MPLELRPDAVWLAIVQGFAQHVKYDAEALRNKFVTHDGEKELDLTSPRLVLD